MQNAENATKAFKADQAAGDEVQQQEEQQQQQQEEPTKIKTRSRFSAAFRSLSKPKAKKPSEGQLGEGEGEAGAGAVAGAEDLTSLDSGQKKRSLTRRLLLGSLKTKAKVRPHSLATSDELSLSLRSSSTERAAASGSSSNTLQITISGKKVEPKATSKGKTQSQSAASETDYLTPTTAATAATTTVAATATAATSVKSATTTLTTTTKDTTSSSRTTKLIVAKVSKEQPKKKKQTKQPHTEEKIVITESKRDTPPRERAPAKPSRANVQLPTSSGTVRNSSSNNNSNNNNSNNNSNNNKPISRKEREQQQRGHRLNRSGATAASAISVQALETPTNTTSPPTYPPPPVPAPPVPAHTSTIVLVSLSDVEEQATDTVSLAESAGQIQGPTHSQIPSQLPVVRFEVGSAVRGPAASAYEAALAAAVTQQPSSSEELSEESSLRRLNFKQQQHQYALSDHDSIEGRRETLRYRSVASEHSQSDQEEAEEEEKEEQPMPAFGDLTMDQEMEPTIMAPSGGGEKREHLYKILVIGELGTGKTSFIKRYVHQFFSQNYRATIGVDFALKVLQWDANTIVRLQLWDIAGQERFGNMTRVYYKEAVGAFIVFDVTRSGTFDCVAKWKEDLDSKVQLPDGSPIPCILLANKCDQEKQGIVTQPERMDEYVRENGFAGWFETSAKENINIDEAARALVNKILINDKLITADANDAEKFNLGSAADANADGKNKCAC